MSDQRNEPGSRQLIRMVNDRMWEEGYAVGVQDSMLRATQYERILQDLIAELRAHSDHAVPVDTLVLESWADRAEQRLKEVPGHG